VRQRRNPRLRGARPPQGLVRALERTVTTACGRDFATASSFLTRDRMPGRLGHQQQSWARLEPGWRIFAAHVSVVQAPLQPPTRARRASRRAA
jgi:hypothetical protein